jgi:hypothetical protein
VSSSPTTMVSLRAGPVSVIDVLLADG